MNGNQLPVSIRLVTEIRELGEKAVTVIEEPGTFLQKGNIAVLKFIEHREDEETIDSLITISEDKVSIKRTGAVDMHQQFKKKQRTENVYRHAHGTIHMETHTDQITYQELTSRQDGKLFISYTTKLNGEGNRRHRLTLQFKEAPQ
ncbi:hypothetical protein Pryu01_00911 [Paraliobacillus ryukyuensis]|uniref:Uncharacterized beta-barrel protein YwiB (DUF1934 family) n=1 Tax=Paraliobacillus ryukyuensis TaxID=200904 RepID=A0A366EEQ9_9BACI|nr:DUF1934 domain-containing protein [Paraliobacillus ryukyuensis]RBP00516.1 uncharacterized beta-barrel protein YwiB (DUF1934 family) [Paraliobacillus ryukyuensis]